LGQSAVVLGDDEVSKDVPAGTCQSARHLEQKLRLVAALLTAKAPFAEVLAVVAEQSVAIFAEAGARPVNHLGGIEARRAAASNPNSAFLRETCKRYLFHRAPAKPADH